MTLKKILHFSVGPIGSALIGLITLPIIASFFAAEDIGRLTMLQVTIGLSILLFGLGLDQAYVREFHEESNKAALLRTSLFPGVFIMTAVMALLLVMPFSLSELLFEIDSPLITGLLLAAIFMSFISTYLGLILRMSERGLAFSMSQLLPKLLFLTIVVAYFLVGATSVFINLMIAQVAAFAAVLAVFAWNTRANWIPAFSAQIDYDKMRMMIRYALPLIGSALAYWGLTTMDRFFLRAMSSFEELGVYAIAVNVAGAAMVFAVIFTTIWTPTLYKWVAEGIDPKRVQGVMEFVALALVVLWSLAGMLSWFLAYILPHILPPVYVAVPMILLSAMSYPLLYAMSKATGVGTGIQRKTMYSMIAALIALAVNTVANVLWIPSAGAAGAAMASAVAFWVFFVVRTESSAHVWVSLPRAKIHLVVLVGVVLSVFVNIVTLPNSTVALAYFGYLILGLILFRHRFIEAMQFAKAKLHARRAVSMPAA